MQSHPMSRLTVVSRERLIRRHLEEHVPLRTLAAHPGISLPSPRAFIALPTVERGTLSRRAMRLSAHL